MKKIELTKGKFAKIDSNYTDAYQFSWFASYSKGGYFYAARSVNLGNKTKRIYLHKQIMGDIGIVDFINGDTLDCRKSNLRITDRSGDAKNRKGYGTSKFLGVNLHKSKRKHKNKKGVEKIYHSTCWVAKIKIDGKYKHLGCFQDEILAAKEYDKFAKKHHKEFARLNFKQ